MKTIYEFLLKSKTAASTQDLDYIDLGLPSGLLWASCNIGAKEPTDCGDYFMWGSTEPNTNDKCNWAHAPFNNGYALYNAKYFESIKNKVCPNGILAPEYDAATAILGDEWRLPTADEFKELIDNTNHEWIENYKDSKINGMIFTTKTNDAELFIPASGLRGESITVNKGQCGYLWSSSLFTSSKDYARYFIFNDSYCSMRYGKHYYGFCLRAVKE